MRDWLQDRMLAWRQRSRREWESGLVWYRLRYHEAAGPARCLRQLARAPGCGRVALRWQPGAVARLHVGVPREADWLWQQMAADFSFGLTAVRPEPVPLRPLASIWALPWERPFMAHAVGGQLFVDDATADDAAATDYFPDANTARGLAWTLPDPPPVGVALTAAWPQKPPPPEFTAAAPQRDRWLLGWTTAGGDGQLLAAPPGALHVDGVDAVAWLAPQLVQTLAADHRGLVVLDGRGDLAMQLKRSAVVARLLGRGLRFAHLDTPALAEGFDPLAEMPGEDAAGRRQRRRAWFALMDVHRAGLDLLETAPLTDLLGLQKWLAAPGQQRQRVAAQALEAALGRLMARRRTRQWLEWPVNWFSDLPDGAVILTLPGADWASRQLLLAALLAACAAPGVRLVLHGLPWAPLADETGRPAVDLPPQTLVSHGPAPDGGVTVLTGLAVPETTTGAGRKRLTADPVLAEYLHLLPPGTGVVGHDAGLCLTTWRLRPSVTETYQTETEKEMTP